MRLKELRKQRKISQIDLAKALNVAQGTISQWESGARQLDQNKIAMVASYFGVSTDYLLGIKNTPTDDGEREMSDMEIKSVLAAEDPETAELLRLLIDLPPELRRQATDYVQYLASRKDTP